MILERLAIYTVVGLVLNTLGLHTTDDMFWCMMALLWIAEHVARREGYDEATELAQTVWSTAKDMLDQAKQIQSLKDNGNDNNNN
jgi:hypothetical protein